VREAVKRLWTFDNAHISQQEEEADKDQNDGAGHGAAAPRLIGRRRRRLRRWHV